MDYNFFSFGMSGDRQAKCPFPPGSKTMRKLFVLLWIFTFLAAPSHASTKVTVQQLSTMLDELHQQGKPDEAVATKLKELELTEQLSLATMNSFTRDQPGPLTTTQIRILGVESALLPPPPSDLPSDAAPDRPAQAAIMSRALDYAAKQYAQLPKLSADKQTIRFQNGVTGVHTNSSTFSNFASGDPGMNAVNPYLLMLGVHTAPVESEHGIELPQPVEKQKNPASQNGQISQGGAGLVLGVILVDAAKGNLSWLRWEMVDGKKTAVFSFAVPKKQSHYKVNYCCFPVIENIGGAGAVNQGTSMPSIMAQPGGTATSFKSFKADPGYHGELFVDPDGDGRDYWEIEINALATTWDLCMSRPYRSGGRPIKGKRLKNLRAAVNVQGTINDASDTDRGWTIEMAIPFSDLGVTSPRPPRGPPPRPGDTWRVNLARIHYTNKIPQFSSWAVMGEENYHRPEKFGWVQFTDD